MVDRNSCTLVFTTHTVKSRQSANVFGAIINDSVLLILLLLLDWIELDDGSIKLILLQSCNFSTDHCPVTQTKGALFRPVNCSPLHAPFSATVQHTDPCPHTFIVKCALFVY